MAKYINSRHWVADKENLEGSGEVVNFMVDSPADIQSLPKGDVVKESSTALVISTGEVYALTERGWERIGG